MDSIDNVILEYVDGLCAGLWQPLCDHPQCCHISADCILWLLAHRYGYTYAGTTSGDNTDTTKSLGRRFLETRLRFATTLRALQEKPSAMGRITMSCARSRRNAHSISFLVHEERVCVLQADRGRYSLCDWTHEDATRMPQRMRAAHRTYGGLQWVAVDRFMQDVFEHDLRPICGMPCPRITGLVILVHKRLLGTRADREFNDRFMHGANVQLVLPGVAYTQLGRQLINFMSKLRFAKN